jgi:uracil-DNA glycosylase family 4
MKPIDKAQYDANCRDCPRLARFLEGVRKDHPDYHARPVPSFGPANARLLVVGLAPGMHGANRTGRPFTGDTAGVLLYRTLHRCGFANQPGSDRTDDGLKLIGCRITNAVKCLPPANKPRPDEVRRCNRFLAAEIAALRPRAILALGAIAHRAVLMALGLRAGRHSFEHGAVHALPALRARLFDSYHCSRYNTQTRRLTQEMFHALFARIRQHIEET